MDSIPIAQFLETTYPQPSVQLSSEFGDDLWSQCRAIIGKPLFKSTIPREVHILSPRSQEHFRRNLEAGIGCTLEELLPKPEEEDKLWEELDDKIRALSELLQKNRGEGPFVLGKQISYADFCIAGSLQSAKVVHQATFERVTGYEGFAFLHEVCETYMDKKD